MFQKRREDEGVSHFSSKRHRLFSQPSYLQTIIKHVACESVHNMWVRWLFLLRVRLADVPSIFPR